MSQAAAKTTLNVGMADSLLHTAVDTLRTWPFKLTCSPVAAGWGSTTTTIAVAILARRRSRAGFGFQGGLFFFFFSPSRIFQVFFNFLTCVVFLFSLSSSLNRLLESWHLVVSMAVGFGRCSQPRKPRNSLRTDAFAVVGTTASPTTPVAGLQMSSCRTAPGRLETSRRSTRQEC